MSHIYLYSPSGAVRDRAGFKRAVKRLQALGHQVEIDPDALCTWQRFAGDDATRLAAIGRAAASGADIVLTTRGGYGLSRLLDRIDWALIAQSVEQGPAWVGHSDMTALQTRDLIDLLEGGPEFLDSFDTELFGELVEKIIIEGNDSVRFCLKNGLELRESIERTVR